MTRIGQTILMCCVAVALAILSCEDNTINNYYLAEDGFLRGRIAPADSGAVVLTGTTDVMVSIDSSGNFFMNGIQPGNYDVTVYPANYSKRVFEDRIIVAGSGLDFGTIAVNKLPWPILNITPSEGATDVELATTFAIQSYESLNLASLTTGVTFDPPLDGAWREVLLSNGYNYYFGLPYGTSSQTRIRLLPGTSYTVSIDKSITNVVGGSATDDYSQSFTAEPLLVTLYTTPVPGTPVSLRSFHFDLGFNTCVSENAVNEAVRIEPPIGGLWIGDRACQDNPYEIEDGYTEFRLFPFVNSLPPSTEYILTVSGGVDLLENVSLPRDTTFTFVTESPQIISYSPTSGSVVQYLSYVNIDFNTSMDSTSVAEAFALEVLDGDPVPGSYRWYSDYTTLQFAPDIPFQFGVVYVFRVSTAALSLEGAAIEDDIESYFRVR